MEKLIAAQRDFHRRIARTYENLKKAGAAKITLELVQSTLSVLESRWARIEALHERLTEDFPEELKRHEYLTGDFMSEMEIVYVQQRAKLLDVERTLKNAAVGDSPVTARLGPTAQSSTLPRIQLPQFSGRYEDWPSFRDLFSSIVGKDPALSNVERLHYLKTSVKGGAEQLIRSLSSTDENFVRAWSTLTDHFENKRMLVRSYLSALTSLPKMKQESVDDLRKIFHGMVSNVGALEGIGRPISNCTDLLVHTIVELLDTKTRRDWEASLGRSSDPPSYEELRDFLQEQLLTHEAFRPTKSEPSSGKSDQPARTARALHAKKRGAAFGRGCAACNEDHFVMSCEKFRQRTAKERLALVEAHRLCTNCLGRHQLSECPSQKTCTKCAARHHTTLHDALATTPVPAVGTAPSSAVHTARQPRAECPTVLLATARVLVTDRFGVHHAARALVDPGSETCLIAESLAQRLRLARTPTAVAIYGVGGSQTGVSRGRIALTVSSHQSDATLAVSALVLPRLSVYSGPVEGASGVWPHMRDLELADPQFCAADPIELLLGADAYAELALPGLRRGGPAEPIAQQTKLGWIILGPVRSCQAVVAVTSFQCSITDELGAPLRQFWEQEEPPRPPLPLTPEDKACEDHFVHTHSRDPSGRYMVRLPTRSPLSDLSTTRRAATHMLVVVVRRFQRDPAFRTLYENFMAEYAQLGHISPAVAPPANSARVCYLPHHGVMKSTGETAKIRVVFNGSSRTASGTSLNNELLVGPNLLPPLCDVVLRWRRHRYVVAADIEKMYRQILVHPNDRDLQRIFWKVDDRVQEFQLNTVTYGLASAPYLAICTLHQLAEDEGDRFPESAVALRRDAYMDDVLTGASSLLEARLLRDQLTHLCLAGGFPLRKWTANHRALLREVAPEHQQRTSQTSLPSGDLDILGICWSPEEDSFAPSVSGISDGPVTKRAVLAQTARLFDPLGWLAPVVVRAKLLIQTAWLQRLDWDTLLADEETATWKQLQSELAELESIRVPRWIRADSPDCVGEIHGFADASERAYGAVVYLRTIVGKDVRLSLLLAKTRVAPLRQVSLPRLELCAATLLTRLVEHTTAVLSLKMAPVHLWTDSTVTLGWIRGHPVRWVTFVANRVAEIQEALTEAYWHHMPGRDNPADCASRGTSPSYLRDHELWWRDPSFLRERPDLWPVDPAGPLEAELPEQRPIRAHTAAKEEEPAELTRFSSLDRLLRVTAWMRRWRARPNPSADSGSGAILSPGELTQALDTWLRRVQCLAFKAEIEASTAGSTGPTRGPLRRLSPFLDDGGLLRVGGRLKHAMLSEDQRHPIILPYGSHLIHLLVAAHHRRTLHGGTQLTLASLRRRYWVLRGRQVVKRHIYRCLPCLRWRAATPKPQMGNLPRARVAPSRPFAHTGVDFAGPILLRTARGRGHKAYKAFLAIFVCFSSRAVHLEVVSDYTAEAFLAAFRRFVSRRGVCTDMYSDCGTNFVGADSRLRALFKAATQDSHRIVNELATDGVRWHFNPPAAPHFGGLWEAAVKAVKHHLRRVIGEATLTYEEMVTFLAEVEACLNSRPLQALSDDPEDLDALTPMWQRWSQEYVQGLTPRPKWWTVAGNLKEGQLCLIKHESTPPTRWPLARIVRVHPGDDGQVRVMTVRTTAGELRRPVVKIVPLPPAVDRDDALDDVPATP